MTVEEVLLKQFKAAIRATFGDFANEEYTEDTDTDISSEDINELARKVNFYMDR